MSSAAAPRRGLLLFILLGQFTFGLLAMTLCIPSMQEWGAQFAVSQATVQLTFSGYVLAFGALQLLYGPLSDRLGRKQVLLGGLLLAVLASLLAAAAPSMAWLIAARTLQGAGAAACTVVGRAMVQDLFQGPERTRVMAYIGMAMGLGPPTATVLGGQLHVLLGWRSTFIFMALCGGVLAYVTWRGLPAAVARQALPGVTLGQRMAEMLRAYAQLLRLPKLRLMVLMLGTSTASFYAFLSGMPVVLLGYGLGPDRIGFVIMCIPLSYIVGSFVTSRLAHSHSTTWLLSVGQALTVGGLALLVLLALAGVRPLWAVALPLMLMGVGHGFLSPPTLAATVSVVPALAGAAAALAGVMQQALGALGGYTVGLVPHHGGAANLGLVMLGFSLLGLAAYWRWRWLTRRASP